MSNKEVLKIVYDTVYNSTYFSIRELREAGLSRKQVEKFIDLGVLDNQVSNRATQLFKLGCSLSFARMHELAFNCFDKSSDMASNNKTLQVEIFSNSLFCGNLDKSFNFFKKFYDSSNGIHNMYLYLMNMGMDLPKEYQDLVDTFDIRDISSYRYSYDDANVGERVKITKYIFDKNISYAYGTTKGIGADDSVRDLMPIDKDVLCLLKLVKRYQKDLAVNAYKMILNGDYLGLINLYQEKEENGKLSNHNSLILKLAKCRINIENGMEVYPLNYDMNNDIDVLLSGGRYTEVATKVNEKGRTAEEFTKVINKVVTDISKLNKKTIDTEESMVSNPSNSQILAEEITNFDRWLEKHPVLRSKDGSILDQALFVGPYAVEKVKTMKK